MFRELLTLPSGRQVNLRINFYTCALCSHFQAQLQSLKKGEEKVEQDMRAARTRRARRDYCIILSLLLYALQIKLSICLWHESQHGKWRGEWQTEINEHFIFHNAPRCLNSVSVCRMFLLLLFSHIYTKLFSIKILSQFVNNRLCVCVCFLYCLAAGISRD